MTPNTPSLMYIRTVHSPPQGDPARWVPFRVGNPTILQVSQVNPMVMDCWSHQARIHAESPAAAIGLMGFYSAGVAVKSVGCQEESGQPFATLMYYCKDLLAKYAR